MTATTTTQSRIERAATELFYEQGYHATSMRDIASRVGITAGALYNHFPGKQDLLFAISLNTTRALCDEALVRLQDRTDVEDALRTFITWEVVFHASEKLASRVADVEIRALDGKARKTVIALRDAHQEVLVDLLRHGTAEAGWSVANERIVAIGILTLCSEVDRWYRNDGPLTPEQIAEIFVDLIVGGLKAGR
jgi:AcrR family transcriptional regulator